MHLAFCFLFINIYSTGLDVVTRHHYCNRSNSSNSLWQRDTSNRVSDEQQLGTHLWHGATGTVQGWWGTEIPWTVEKNVLKLRIKSPLIPFQQLEKMPAFVLLGPVLCAIWRLLGLNIMEKYLIRLSKEKYAKKASEDFQRLNEISCADTAQQHLSVWDTMAKSEEVAYNLRRILNTAYTLHTILNIPFHA